MAIDKLKVSTPNFEISPHADVVIDRGRVSLADVDTVNSELWPGVEGHKAHVRGEGFTAEISHCPIYDGKDIIGHFPRMELITNPWILAHGGNIGQSDIAKVEEAIEKLPETLAGGGVACDLENAAVHRVDVAANLFTSLDEKRYLPVIAGFVGRSRRLRTVDYGDTVYCRNGATTFVAYSKRVAAKLDGSPPILRLEKRRNNRRSVERNLEAFKFSDLDFREIAQSELGQVLEQLSKKTKRNFKVSTDSLVEVIEHHKESRYWLANSLRDLGLAVLLENYSTEGISQLLTDANVKSERKSAILSRIADIKESNLGLQYTDLRKEVVDLLAKQVDLLQ